MEPLNPSHKDWIRRRADEVRNHVSAFQLLHEHGLGGMLVDEITAIQIQCPNPGHGPDNRPSARYYPAQGARSDYVRCFKEHTNWDSIQLYMMLKGLPFMEALKDLERRFRIRIPKRPEGSPIQDPKDKSSSNYASEAWLDVPRVLNILENKLLRIRNKVSLPEYVKFCRVLDNVQHDLNLLQNQSTPAMMNILNKLRSLMNEVEEVKDLNATD
jgi:hypothetical protein